MHRSSRSSSAAAALLAALLSSCGAPAAEVTLVLRPGDGVELEPIDALKLIVRDLGEEAPEVFGPFALERDRPHRLPALVPPEHDFYIDVWGCPSADFCGPTALSARGCSDIERIPPGSQDRILTIELFPPDHARAADCPPTAP